MEWKFSKKQLLPPVLSGSTLKWIAIVTMLIDHIGAVLFENGFIKAYNQQLSGAFSYSVTHAVWYADIWMRRIGRVAFPIFCFLLVEGFFHTSNRKKYALRLGIFALVSEVPFDLAFRSSILEFTYQNVMVTLFIGFLTIWAMEVLRRKNPAWMAVAAGLGVLTGYLARSDYGWKGIILILIFYLFYYQPVEKTIAGCLALLWEAPACFAFLSINLYNHQRGRGDSFKYFFYWFYPVHILVLVGIRYGLFGI